MFKLFASLVLTAAVAGSALAAPHAPQPIPSFRIERLADTTQYKEYVGKYAMKDAPFPTILVTLENGKLMGEAVDQGKGELVPDEKTADQFSVTGYEALVVFNRDADKKVTKMALTVQGQTFEGEKQP